MVTNMFARPPNIGRVLLLLFIILIVWYVYMDIQLYVRIQYYASDRSAPVTPSSSSSESNYPKATFNTFATTETNHSHSQHPTKYEDVSWIRCDLNPLCYVTVKALMLDQTNHYLFAPLVILFDREFSISDVAWITPNLISFTHVFVALFAARLVASDSLGTRRIGVLVFQLRTFMDDLDGHVARERKHIRGEHSEFGSSGFYIDGICDGLGCIALLIGIYVHLRNNPPRRGYMHLHAILPVKDDVSVHSNGSECGVVYKSKVGSKKVIRNVLCFGGQLLLSSTAWNRYIAAYQDMLERNDVQSDQFARQMLVLRSPWFFVIIWMWRIVNVHSMLHYLVLMIFCDRLWWFLQRVQYAGYVMLLIIICATEIHVLEVQQFVFHSIFVPVKNYTTAL